MMGCLCGDEAGLQGGSCAEAFAGTIHNADTLAFLRTVRHCPSLAAVLSGHLHTHQVHPLGDASGALQLVEWLRPASTAAGSKEFRTRPDPTAAAEARL
jgi:hypothetical protein